MAATGAVGAAKAARRILRSPKEVGQSGTEGRAGGRVGVVRSDCGRPTARSVPRARGNLVRPRRRDGTERRLAGVRAATADRPARRCAETTANASRRPAPRPRGAARRGSLAPTGVRSVRGGKPAASTSVRVRSLRRAIREHPRMGPAVPLPPEASADGRERHTKHQGPRSQERSEARQSKHAGGHGAVDQDQPGVAAGQLQLITTTRSQADRDSWDRPAALAALASGGAGCGGNWPTVADPARPHADSVGAVEPGRNRTPGPCGLAAPAPPTMAA